MCGAQSASFKNPQCWFLWPRPLSLTPGQRSLWKVCYFANYMIVLVLRVGVRKVFFGSQPVTGRGSACLAYARGLRLVRARRRVSC